jgi:hypothetical protein
MFVSERVRVGNGGRRWLILIPLLSECSLLVTLGVCGFSNFEYLLLHASFISISLAAKRTSILLSWQFKQLWW